MTIGLASDQQTLVVVNTYINEESLEVVRMIWARKATKKERVQDKEGI